jgi:hypothetical protein
VLLGLALLLTAPAAQAQINLRASVSTSGAEADHFSFRAAISTDGRWVAFHSRAANLVTGDTNNEDDVFVHDLYAGVTTRVSVSAAGLQGDGDSRDPAISADGRFVTFRSFAANLVPNDNNGTWDIFIRDRDFDGNGVFDETGGTRTLRVSLGSLGGEANGSSYSSSVSADGRWVAFDSAATNLTGVEPNALDDVFVRDRQSGTTQRVSVNSAGDPADNGGDWPSISADGRWVAFDSLANNLVVGDTNLKSDVFVHDLQTGDTVRVSVDSNGIQGDNTSHLFDTHHAISGNGRFVVFSSSASNFSLSDTNNTFDVFVHDRDSDEDGVYDEPGAILTIHASTSASGVGGNSQSEHANIADDGRYVVFDSVSDNLVTGDTGIRDVFLRDLVAQTIRRVSLDAAGGSADGASTDPTVTDGGRITAFHSAATDQVPGDANGRDDIIARGPAALLCLDARGPDPELAVLREPPGGCPQAIGPQRDFIRGQVTDLVEGDAVIFVGPVRCADDGLATTEQVLPQHDLDLAPRRVRFYLMRLTGEDDFGDGFAAGGFPLARVAGAIPCP